MAERAEKLPVLMRPLPFALTCGIGLSLSGLFFALPPGPLCDEGMVLFFEGGCDWGDSNLFFYSKLWMLLAINACFVFALWRRLRRPARSFWPHLLLLGALHWLVSTDPGCQTYYAHPQGVFDQTLLVGATFAVLGLVVATKAANAPRAVQALVWLAWNAANVLAFYLALQVSPYWQWRHSFMAAGLLGGAAIAAGVIRSPRGESAPAAA